MSGDATWASALLDTGAELGQGFLFARPGFPVPLVTWPPAAGTVV